MYKSKISTLDIPRLLWLSLTRAKATLLMKAVLEKMASEQEEKNAEKQAQVKKVKVVSDMPLMKPPELFEMASMPRVLQSESSSKVEGKGTGKGKPICSIPKLCAVFAKTRADHCRGSKLEA